MNKINVVTVSGAATSATAVTVTVPEYQQARAVVRRFSGIGNDSACVVSWWLPRRIMAFNLIEVHAATDTAFNVPVDVLAGHVVKGHTLSTSDKILLPAANGEWKVVAISNVADASGKMYCTATVSATGLDLPANTRAYILRSADRIAALPTVGNGSASVTDLLSGDPGAPVIMELVADTSKKLLGCVFAEYWF